MWKQFLLERFLARQSNSTHQNKFIFKGGLLLAQYLEIGRETTDADFLLTKGGEFDPTAFDPEVFNLSDFTDPSRGITH